MTGKERFRDEKQKLAIEATTRTNIDIEDTKQIAQDREEKVKKKSSAYPMPTPLVGTDNHLEDNNQLWISKDDQYLQNSVIKR